MSVKSKDASSFRGDEGVAADLTASPASSVKSQKISSQSVDSAVSEDELRDAFEIPVRLPPIAQCQHWRDPPAQSEDIYESPVDCNTNNLVRDLFSDDPENDVWDVYTRTEPSLSSFLDDYSRTNWRLSDLGCCLERVLRFKSSADLPFGIGQSVARCEQTHRVHRDSETRLIYRTRAVALEVPYADTFVVESRWVFEQGVSGVSNMQVTVDVVFLKSCWVKGIILKSSLPPAVANTRAAAKLLVETSLKLKKARPVGKKLMRKNSIAQLVQDMPQKEFETIFTANQEIQETQKKEGEVGRGAVAAGKLLFLGWSFAALLAAMWLLRMRIESLTRANARLQRELLVVGAMLGSVFDCPSQHCGDRCAALADLPADLLVVTMRDMVQNQTRTAQLLEKYQSKLHSLSAVLGEPTSQPAFGFSLDLELGDFELSWPRVYHALPGLTANTAFSLLILGSVCAFLVAWGWWLQKTRSKA